MNDVDELMNDLDYELISQYIDGELPAEEAMALRRRLLAEPELRTAYDRMRRADDKVRGAFAGAWTEKVPERISAMLAGSSQGGDSQRRAASSFLPPLLFPSLPFPSLPFSSTSLPFPLGR